MVADRALRSARVERDVCPYSMMGFERQKHNNTGRFRSCAESSNHGQLANSPAWGRPWRHSPSRNTKPAVEGGPVSGKAGKAQNLTVLIFPEILNRCKRLFAPRSRFA
jgi:hypothetical protein